jgi:ribose 5-phosphate isomerase B
MNIYIGSDHRGFALKSQVIEYLRYAGHKVFDVGDTKLDPDDDFPVFAARAVQKVLGDPDSDARAILICGSGQGMAIAANRYRGIRAALGWSVGAAKSTRNDEDSNVLALPAELMEESLVWKDIVGAWLLTPFANAPRFVRRNKQLDQL